MKLKPQPDALFPIMFGILRKADLTDWDFVQGGQQHFTVILPRLASGNVG